MSTDTEIVNAFLEAERKARAKHPVFANFFTQYIPPFDYHELRKIQIANDEMEKQNCGIAVQIILEELIEAAIAYTPCDFYKNPLDKRNITNLEHCLSELHQLGGCVISAVKMIEREIQNRKEKHETQKAEVAAARHRGQERQKHPQQKTRRP